MGAVDSMQVARAMVGAPQEYWFGVIGLLANGVLAFSC